MATKAKKPIMSAKKTVRASSVVKKRSARSAATKSMVVSKRDSASGRYTGRWAKVGNSDGFRIEKRLFKDHPEFQEAGVVLKFIAPGKFLLEAEEPADNKDDVVMTTFLSYLNHEMEMHPEDIVPMDQNLLDDIGDLVDGVTGFE